MALAVTALIVAPVRPGRAEPFPIDLQAGGANGTGRINTPGRPCADGGDGASWHYDYRGGLAPGAFGAGPAELRFHADLHSDVVTRPQPGVFDSTPSGPAAFLPGSGPRPSDGSEVLGGGPTDAGVRELRSRLTQGQAATWHAPYKIGASAELSAAPQTLEVWREKGRVRHDLKVTSGAETAHTTSFRDPDRHITCRQAGDEPWNCSEVASRGLDPASTFDLAVTELGDRTVPTTEARIGGVEGRCYRVAGGKGDAEVCVTSDGVPLKISGAGAAIELVSLDGSVPDSVFKPPAPVS